MENFNKTETSPDPALETRLLTPKELLDFARASEFLNKNVNELAQDPNVKITMTQTRDGTPIEIEIIQDGEKVYYDNLAFWRNLKNQKQQPGDTIH